MGSGLEGVERESDGGDWENWGMGSWEWGRDELEGRGRDWGKKTNETGETWGWRVEIIVKG